MVIWGSWAFIWCGRGGHVICEGRSCGCVSGGHMMCEGGQGDV